MKFIPFPPFSNIDSGSVNWIPPEEMNSAFRSFGNFDFNSFKNDFEKSKNEFDNFSSAMSSAMKWGIVGSVVSSVVMICAIVAIVYALIECLKKTGTAVYTKVSNIDSDEKNNTKLDSSPEHVAVAIPPISSSEYSQVELETVQKFIRKTERERRTIFSAEELEVFTKNYSNKLGSGGFGVVYKGEFPDGVPVAVKVLVNDLDKRVEQQFMAEVRTLGKTFHKNLVRLLGFCFETEKIALIYEFIENGDLGRFLFSENNDLDWGKMLGIAIGTAEGIAYLHHGCENTIIHYDIKPGNILLDKNLNAKVADFGLAKLCSRDSSNEQSLSCGRGTRGYAAPEMREACRVTNKCDVYSFGKLLFDIIGRKRNRDLLIESRDQLPKWAWEMLEKNEMGEMLSQCGIEDGADIEKAERMVKVALLCVQYRADPRPDMEDVVKMLKGKMPIVQYPEFPAPNLASGNGSNEAQAPEIEIEIAS